MRAFIILLIIALAGIAFADNTEDESAQDSDTAPDAPNPVILPFRTYHAKWLRYTNAHDGQPILAHEDATKFAYRFISSGTPLGITELADADTLASILDAAAYTDSAIAGNCKTDKLPGDLPDVFCAPGTSAMPFGHVILALYEPETNEIAALTTSIDNNAGRRDLCRLVADCCACARTSGGRLRQLCRRAVDQGGGFREQRELARDWRQRRRDRLRMRGGGWRGLLQGLCAWRERDE